MSCPERTTYSQIMCKLSTHRGRFMIKGIAHFQNILPWYSCNYVPCVVCLLYLVMTSSHIVATVCSFVVDRFLCVYVLLQLADPYILNGQDNFLFWDRIEHR